DCPALKFALPLIVNEKRGYLTEEDIAERLRHFQESNVGLMGTRCRVTRGEVGVPGVTVTFIPEKFMGDVIKPGSGISNNDGYVNLATGPEDLPGLSLGYYRVEVSLKDAAGNETLPARFNARSSVGMEIQNIKRSEILRID